MSFNMVACEIKSYALHRLWLKELLPNIQHTRNISQNDQILSVFIMCSSEQYHLRFQCYPVSTVFLGDTDSTQSLIIKDGFSGVLM